MVSAESQAAMEAAKKAVMEFMSKNGRHDTTVHERVAPAVYHETISRTEREELVTLVDREITQDHYHTSVQPITDSETLEEQHHHNVLPVEKRSFEHDDQNDRDLRLEAEMAKFKNEVQHVDGERTQTVIPMVAAEHIHHHVHEIIQPVVTKHTISPHVIHTTVQVHERVHNASTHHTMSALPVVTMAEFKRQGGILIGREERWDSFEGEPRSVGGALGTPNTNTSGATASAEHNNNNNTAHTAAAPASSSSNQTQSSAPTAPIRRSSMQPSQQQSQPQPQPQPAQTDKPLPTPSAAALESANKPNPQQSQDQASSSASRAGQQQATPAAPGRFGLLPMNLARSAGDAKAGQMGHQPASAPLRSSLASSSSSSQQQQQGQQGDARQGSVAGGTRPGPAGQGQEQGRKGT